MPRIKIKGPDPKIRAFFIYYIHNLKASMCVTNKYE